MSQAKYDKLIKKMKNENYAIKGNDGKYYQDKESYHIEQDVIYRTFIRDIATGRIKNLEEIVDIAKLLNNKVVNYDRNMWYA
jgi:hypothetical protein